MLCPLRRTFLETAAITDDHDNKMSRRVLWKSGTRAQQLQRVWSLSSRFPGRFPVCVCVLWRPTRALRLAVPRLHDSPASCFALVLYRQRVTTRRQVSLVYKTNYNEWDVWASFEGSNWIIVPAIYWKNPLQVGLLVFDFSNKTVLLFHLSAVVEVSVAALMTVWLTDPFGALEFRTCNSHQLADWYTLFHNPQPNYEQTIYCTQEAVYPLWVLLSSLSHNSKLQHPLRDIG